MAEEGEEEKEEEIGSDRVGVREDSTNVANSFSERRRYRQKIEALALHFQQHAIICASISRREAAHLGRR